MTLRCWTASLALAAALVFSGCAPAQQGPAASVAQTQAERPQVWAAFSPEGAVWSDGRQACVARLPQLQPVCPPWPAPTGAVAWNGGRAWAALPSLGQAVTVDGAAETLAAGRVAAMSSTRLYREDGSALSYSGAAMPGTLGRPTQVLTGGDGRDYALVERRFWHVDRGHSEALPPGRHVLMAVPSGAEITRFPTVDTPVTRLELRDGQVFQPGAADAITLPGPVQALGTIGNETYILLGGSGRWELLRLPR